MPEPRPKILRYTKMDPADPAFLAKEGTLSSGEESRAFGSGLLSWLKMEKPFPGMVEGTIFTTVAGILRLAQSKNESNRALAASYIAEPLSKITFTADEQVILNNFKPRQTGNNPDQELVQAIMNWFKVLYKNKARGASPEAVSIMKKLAEFRQEHWQKNLESGQDLFTDCRQDLVKHLSEFGAKHDLQFSPRAVKRMERAMLVLEDPISMRLKGAVGEYGAELGRITMKVSDVDKPTAFKTSLRHELFHAASGHLLMRDRQTSTMSDFDLEDTMSAQSMTNSTTGYNRLLELMTQVAAGLEPSDKDPAEEEYEYNDAPEDIIQYTRVGMHFSDIGRDRFRWLGEAMTERLTRLYHEDKGEIMDDEDGYEKDEELFALLLSSGSQAIPESVALNAHLEDYDPAIVGNRLPEWQTFAKKIAQVYEPGGFLPRLDNVVRERGLDETIALMQAHDFSAIMQTPYPKARK